MLGFQPALVTHIGERVESEVAHARHEVATVHSPGQMSAANGALGDVRTPKCALKGQKYFRQSCQLTHLGEGVDNGEHVESLLPFYCLLNSMRSKYINRV